MRKLRNKLEICAMAVKQGPVVVREFEQQLDPGSQWKIDWIGDPRPPLRHEAQHMIDVLLSPCFHLFRGDPSSPGATDLQRQRRVAVGVGYFPILHIGAVFRNGEQIYQPPNTRNRYRLVISPSKSQTIRLGSSPGPNSSTPNNGTLQSQPSPSWFVPRERFSFGPLGWKHAQSSLMLAFPSPDGSDPFFVVIPCIEIPRFFFCISSLLSRHLFSNGWTDLIWDGGCQTDGLPPGYVKVGLQNVKGLKYRDALHFGFYLKDAQTRAVVQSIPKSLQKTIQKNSADPFWCDFPFLADTEIQADAIRIPANTKLGFRYFVTRLTECRRPIPFKVCLVHPLIHPGQGENADSADLLELRMSKGNESLGESDQPDTSGDSDGRFLLVTGAQGLPEPTSAGDDLGAPAASGTELIVATDEDTRFPGLDAIPRLLSKKESQKYKHASPRRKPIPVPATSASTAEPVGSRPIAALDLDSELKAVSDHTLRRLIESVPYLARAGFPVEVLPLCRLKKYEPRLSIFQRSWAGVMVVPSIADGRRRVFRSRLMAGLLIGLDDVCCVVGEIERRKSSERFGLAAFYLDDADAAHSFWEGALPEAVVARNGWPEFNSQAREYKLSDKQILQGERGVHRGVETAEALAQKIIATFLSDKDPGAY